MRLYNEATYLYGVGYWLHLLYQDTIEGTIHPIVDVVCKLLLWRVTINRHLLAMHIHNESVCRRSEVPTCKLNEKPFTCVSPQVLVSFPDPQYTRKEETEGLGTDKTTQVQM